MLVCAPRKGDDPEVVVAHGSFESGRERVFWLDRPEREVLRIPLHAPVSQRPLRTPSGEGRSAGGEAALTRAVQRQLAKALPVPRPSTDTPAGQAPVPAEAPWPDANDLTSPLRAALLAGDRIAACAHTDLLRGASSVTKVYNTIASTLADIGEQWATGTAPVLAERRATTAAQAVIQHLEQTTPPPTAEGCVVLAAPVGDRHRLALELLAHAVHEAGRPALVVEDLPLDELVTLASSPDVAAVVVSAHLPLPLTQARRIVLALRTATHPVLVALGGPGFLEPTDGRGSGADLVSSDPDELLRELNRHAGALTRRECEVLLAVADGLTNRQIADQLGLSQNTVKSHLDRVLTKTQTEHRAAAVAHALREGWIT